MNKAEEKFLEKFDIKERGRTISITSLTTKDHLGQLLEIETAQLDGNCGIGVAFDIELDWADHKDTLELLECLSIVLQNLDYLGYYEYSLIVVSDHSEGALYKMATTFPGWVMGKTVENKKTGNKICMFEAVVN